jgi:hypothetical protein
MVVYEDPKYYSCVGFLAASGENHNGYLLSLLCIFGISVLLSALVHAAAMKDITDSHITKWRYLLLLSFNHVAVNLLDLVPVPPVLYYNIKFNFQPIVCVVMYAVYVTPAVIGRKKDAQLGSEKAPNSDIKVPTMANAQIQLITVEFSFEHSVHFINI